MVKTEGEREGGRGDEGNCGRETGEQEDKIRKVRMK